MHDPQEFQPGENTKMWREDVFHGRAGKLWNGSTFVWRGTDTLQPVSLKRVHYTGGAGGAGGGRWRKVETRLWMGANGDNMEMENKCCCWRDAAKTSSHPCRMNMWFVLLKWTSTSGRFNIIYVNKEQNYWKKRTHKWKTVGREYFFSLLVLADISCHQVKFITVLTFKTLDQLFCRRPERRDNPTGAGGIPLQTKTEGGPLGAADHWVHINTVEAEELALQLNPLYILLN